MLILVKDGNFDGSLKFSVKNRSFAKNLAKGRKVGQKARFVS